MADDDAAADAALHPDSNQIRSAAIAAGWEVVRREMLASNDVRWVISRDAE